MWLSQFMLIGAPQQHRMLQLQVTVLQFFYYPKDRIFTKLELTFEVDGGLLQARASAAGRHRSP